MIPFLIVCQLCGKLTYRVIYRHIISYLNLLLLQTPRSWSLIAVWNVIIVPGSSCWIIKLDVSQKDINIYIRTCNSRVCLLWWRAPSNREREPSQACECEVCQSFLCAVREEEVASCPGVSARIPTRVVLFATTLQFAEKPSTDLKLST